MDSRYYKRCFLSVAILTLQLLYIIIILLQNNTLKIQIYRDLGFYQSFQGIYANTDSVLELYYSSIFIIAELFCFGTYIYSDIGISNIYYFSRNANIKIWYAYKLFNLHIMTTIYCTLYISLTICLIIALTGQVFSIEIILFALKHIILSSLYSYLLCIFANFCALLSSSIKSMLVTNVIHIIIVFFLFSVHSEKSKVDFPILYINELENAKFALSFIIINLISIVFNLSGYIAIKKYDIGLNVKETEI